MKQTPIDCGKQWPPLSSNCAWLIAQNLDGIGDQTFYTLHDHFCHYKSRIPKLLGNLIRGYSHGWLILSNKKMWSLWNPVTSKIKKLPPLILGSSESVGQCCLSSPPDDPISVLLVTITEKPTFVFCRLGFERDGLRWTRMPYNRQLKEIVGHYNGFLQCLTCYNDKVYAVSNVGDFVIQVDIDGEALIKLSVYTRCPSPSRTYLISIPLLKATSSELFYIVVAFNEVTKVTLRDVYLFKWVMPSMRWEKVLDLKDAIFFVDLARDNSVFYNHAVSSELGGYIHIRDKTGKMMHSYNFQDKTISLSFMAYPISHVSYWECRLKGDHEVSQLTLYYGIQEEDNAKINVRSATGDVELNESPLLNLPFNLLETIMDFCIGIEYMRFRATCKHCHLVAPSVQWSHKTALRRLHKYSVASPWLMVLNKNRDIITFTDPMLGDKFFMKKSQVSIYNDERTCCSRFGWLLFYTTSFTLMFLNPFTGDTYSLPLCLYHFESVCFSAPPTSHDCVVVGFTYGGHGYVCIYFVAREQSWVTNRLDFSGATPNHFWFPTFCGRDLYTLCDKGGVYVFKNICNLQGFRHKKVVDERCSEGEYFLVKHDQQLLLVTVGKLGEYVKVYKSNDYIKKWEKLDSLGSYMLYICGTTCLCIKAKTSEMENKIFFPRLDSKNRNVVFYSLETHRYHTFHNRHVEEIAGIGMKHVFPHVWIEPTWS